MVFFAGIVFLLNYCKKETDEIKISRTIISGYAQKGPYVNGTSIQMYELNSSLDQTGKVFSTQITNNKGSFEINDINLSSQYVQFSANGYYFNEISGEVSASPLTLNAISDITDISTVNVNILTHLEKSRVEYLLDNGKSFTEAKETAQRNVLAIFGFQLNDMDPSELLDISVDKEENAILIAISLILQGNRSVGDMTEMMANIVTDIRQDGQLNNNAIITDLVSSASALDLSSIRSNLQARYTELGLTVTIPDFEQYIIDFVSQNGAIPAIYEISSSDLSLWGATMQGTVNANGIVTNVVFEYGTSIAYGSAIDAEQSPVTGGSNTSVSARVSNLDPATLYHYRIKATNIIGTSYSVDSTFTTYGGPAEAATEGHLYPSSDGILACGSVKPPLGITAVYSFEYGPTTDYGNWTEWNEISGNTFTDVNMRITGLEPDTEYHYRIVANDETWCYLPIYGEDKTFRTLSTINDIEGNIYKIVELPNGIWMAENLKTTKYNNGDIIETTIPDTLGLTPGSIANFQWAYDGDENNVPVFGRLYTWYAATDSRRVCPTGWHIPSNDEWNTLSSCLGGDSISGSKLKEAGNAHWIEPNWAVTNESGFTALPGGNRRLYTSPIFVSIGSTGFWWSSSEFSATQAIWINLFYNSIWFYTRHGSDKCAGFSIRCKQD